MRSESLVGGGGDRPWSGAASYDLAGGWRPDSYVGGEAVVRLKKAHATSAPSVASGTVAGPSGLTRANYGPALPAIGTDLPESAI